MDPASSQRNDIGKASSPWGLRYELSKKRTAPGTTKKSLGDSARNKTPRERHLRRRRVGAVERPRIPEDRSGGPPPPTPPPEKKFDEEAALPSWPPPTKETTTSREEADRRRVTIFSLDDALCTIGYLVLASF